MIRKITLLYFLIFSTLLCAQRKIFVDGLFVKNNNDTIRAKFLVRASQFKINAVSLDSFYKIIRYSTDSLQINEISDKDVKYLEFNNLEDKKIILTSSENESYLSNKFNLYLKIIEGKISWYQGLGWEPQNGLHLVSFFLRKDNSTIHQAGFLYISEKNAVIDLVGEKDMNEIFSGENKMKGGNLKKIKNYIKIYNKSYIETLYESPYYD